MTTRRTALKYALGAAAAAALARGAAAAKPAPTILILGGTGFIGPSLTKEALDRGWKVTHFNRGHTAAEGVPGVETLLGDRKGKLEALRGRRWDVVVDDTGFIPKYVKMSMELLAPECGYCMFVSSISAYASLAQPSDENSPTATLTDLNVEEITEDTYGPMKAQCERYTLEAFKGRACIVRPGYIVGPLDKTDRFTYWPVRAARGGEMLAPGTPADPIQIIDVRDLAAWMMELVVHRTRGAFNAVTPPRALTMGDLLTASVAASPEAHTKVTWVSEDFLAAHWKAEELDFPPWSPSKGEFAGASLCSTAAAQRTGLKCRPLDVTVRDTLAWFRSLPPERQAKLRAGLDPQKEAETLKAWHESGHA